MSYSVTREDVLLVVKLKDEGVPIYFSVHVLFKMSYDRFHYHIKKWGCINKKTALNQEEVECGKGVTTEDFKKRIMS